MDSDKAVMLSHTSYIRRCNAEDIIIKSGKFVGEVYPKIWYNCPIAMSTVMVRREYLRRQQFLEYIDSADDVILWAKIARWSLILAVDEPLSCITVGADTTAFNKQRQLTSIHNIVEYGIKRASGINYLRKAVLLLHWNIARMGIGREKSLLPKPLRFLDKYLLGRLLNGNIT